MRLFSVTLILITKGHCPSRQYAQQDSKVWHQGDAQSSYAWKMQVYTGTPTSGGAEKNQGIGVVTDGLRGHNVTCDIFFTIF